MEAHKGHIYPSCIAHIMTRDVQNYVLQSACALKGMQLQIKLCQQVKAQTQKNI